MLYLVINIIRYSEILIVKIEKLETATGPMTPYKKLRDYAQLGARTITRPKGNNHPVHNFVH